MRAYAKAQLRATLSRIYSRSRQITFLQPYLDKAVVEFRSLRGVKPAMIPALSKAPDELSESSVPPAAIETFNDLQAARIVLNAAELLRVHRDKMGDLVAGLPPLAALEQLLSDTKLTDDRIQAELTALTKAEPDFAEAWLELGFIHLDRDEFQRAEACFEKCLSVPLVLPAAPDRTGCHVQAALGKARALVELGNLDAAAHAYFSGLAANGASGLARIEYARLLRRLGRVRDSLGQFEAGMGSDVTAVSLPPMPRMLSELSDRLKARFAGVRPAAPPRLQKARALADKNAVPADVPPPDKSRVSSRMRLRLVTVVWGESFIDIYLRITARSLLAAGNLEALAQKYNVSYSIHTTEEDARRLRASPVFRRIQEIVAVDIVAFDERVIDVKNPSSHWTLWRVAADRAKRAGETIFFIIPDMVFAVDTLARWGRRFEEGYRAVCMASPQVVLETALSEIESRFPPGDGPIFMNDGEVHDLLLRQLHPLMIAMYRDTTRPSRHSDSLLAEAKDVGLVMRVLASQPFCIDLNYFEVNNAFCPLDHLEDIAYEQPYTVCLEPMLKYPDLYFRKSPRSDDRLSNMGSWIDYHLGPSDVLWASHNSRFVAQGRDNERSFRRAETAMGQFVGQMRMTGSIYRVMQALREAGCRTAAQVLSLAHYAARLRRHWLIKGEVTIVVPGGDGDMGLPAGALDRLLAPGNEELLRSAIFDHVFPGKLNFSIGDGLARANSNGAPVVTSGVVTRGAATGAAAEVLAGPIEVDDCTIYVIDRPLSYLPSRVPQAVRPPPRSQPSVLPNRWAMTPARIIGKPPVPKNAPPPPVAEPAAAAVPVQQSVVASLDTFLKNYFEEASKEDASRAGGLNGHLSVARLLELDEPLLGGTAAVLVSMGALFHRLHYFKEITDRYCDAIGLPQTDMSVEALIDSLTDGKAPLQRARELYEAALLVDPGSAQAMLNLAGVRTLEGNGKDADRLYRAAAQQDPSLAGHVALRRAALCEAAQQWSDAARLYLDAAAVLGAMGEWHENAARCLRQCGRYDEALQQYYLALDWFRRPGVEFFVARPQALADQVKS